jgi:uncharacterized protein (TIGR02217 family)
MSNAVFPTLPGLRFPVTRTPMWKTMVRTTPSNREYRATNITIPKYRISLGFEFLRARAALAEYQTLIGFFNARRGASESFVFSDPDDRTATTQIFGVGDGSTKTFQLVRGFGGFSEPVFALDGSASIYKDAVLQGSGYSISSTGVVTFTTAPASGVVLTWTGNFYWRVRFSRDDLDFEKFARDFFEAKKVELVTLVGEA